MILCSLHSFRNVTAGDDQTVTMTEEQLSTPSYCDQNANKLKVTEVIIKETNDNASGSLLLILPGPLKATQPDSRSAVSAKVMQLLVIRLGAFDDKIL